MKLSVKKYILNRIRALPPQASVGLFGVPLPLHSQANGTAAPTIPNATAESVNFRGLC